jgi:hypothetical protein
MTSVSLWLKKKVKFYYAFLITVANENFNLAGALQFSCQHWLVTLEDDAATRNYI